MMSESKSFDLKNRIPLVGGVVTFAIVLCLGGWLMLEWTINRVYVPVGKSMLLVYKGVPLPFFPNKPNAKPGEFARVENGWVKEKGVLKEMLGPGRHFKCPLWWERELVDDVVVKPGEVAIVRSKMGKDLPAGEFIVDGDLGETEFKGTLRKVFGPGKYRVNPYAYDVTIIETEKKISGKQTKHAGWVNIPTGYVGVVTNLTDNPITGAKRGVQDEVYQPGIYPVNPREQQIDLVEIGYRDMTIQAELQRDRDGGVMFDAAGEPMIDTSSSGISFPSNDGFPISMDFTAIWGILPDQAPDVISKFGNIDAVETNIVIPQIGSICRTMGQKKSAQELLVGDTRQSFQQEVYDEFSAVLQEKNITLLEGLVRHIHIPQEVRLPIQEAFIADELKLTREQEQLTTQTEGLLEEATQTVELEAERIRVETEKLVAKTKAEGEKKAQETAAETKKLVAEIDKEIARFEADAKVLIGEAEAKAKQMSEEAKADKFKLAVEAFGDGEAYNKWVFANGLPEDIQLDLLYAGEGTFWTDLKGFSETMLGRQEQQRKR